MVNGMGGGVSSEIMGGRFEDGFKVAFVTAAAAYAYNSAVNYEATWKSGGDAMSKTALDTAFKDVNNVGVANRQVDPSSWFGEGGRVSRVLNQVPGVNAVAGMHDNMQVWFDTISNSSDGWLRTVANVPAMIPATALAYGALASDYTALIMQEQQLRREY